MTEGAYWARNLAAQAGIDGLLAVAAGVRRLREMWAGADKGSERCLEML